MAPSHIGPAPMAARNAGSTAVAVSWLQSLKRLVRPTPSTVRFSQDCSSGASGMGRQFIVESAKLKVRSFADRDRKSTRLNSSHSQISYAVFCLKKKKYTHDQSCFQFRWLQNVADGVGRHYLLCIQC